MPLAGVILPTHQELSESEPGRFPQWLPPDELLEEAKHWSPKESPWNYELLNAMLEGLQERDYISSTFLVSGCGRGHVLERKEPYIALAEDFYAAFRGTQIHLWLEEAARPGSVAEARFFTTINGTEVSCSPDLITAQGIWDYKTTENPPMYYPWKNHKRQVQLNRYIINHAEKWTKENIPFTMPFNPRTTEFEHLTLVYIGPKGPKPMVLEKKQPFINPKGKEIMKNQPFVAPDNEVEEWLMPLLDMYLLALDSYPVWPKGLEDMWIPDTSGNAKVYPFGGAPGWRCPGPPLCHLPGCLGKRYPDGLMWPKGL